MSKFNMIMKNYPRYTEIASSNLLKELFSGIEDWVLNETNTCAIRVSAALNEAGVLIQRGVANKKHYIKGRGWKTHDKKYDYILRATGMIEYLNKKYGRPVEEYIIDIDDKLKYRRFRHQIENMSGIIALKSKTGSNVTGHVDIWNKGRFLGKDYFGADWIDEIYFWTGSKIK